MINNSSVTDCRREAGTDDGASPADLITAIDALLPQTQCTRCGYPDCRSYAQAIAETSAPLNRCPPGGQYTIGRLAALLDGAILELDPECGCEAPRQVAQIDEQWCIGCTLCIQACPVDAIVGAAKRMHTIVDEWCNGCELCLPPCPVDCIELTTPHSGPREAQGWLLEKSALMRDRYQQHQHRKMILDRKPQPVAIPDLHQRRNRIAEAVAREHQRRGQNPGAGEGNSG